MTQKHLYMWNCLVTITQKNFINVIKINEEKPKYGWYVKNLIVGLLIMGSIGLVIFIIGLLFQGFMSVILLILGAILLIIFMWPTIGMITLNLVLGSKNNLDKGYNVLDEIESPQILDVGCGTGATAIKIAKALKNRGHLNGIDIYNKLAISGNALETVKKNAIIEKVDNITTFQYGSATDIPFEDEIFDFINVSSVLHEIHDIKGREKAVQEISRVLKPGGYLLIGEWNRTSWQTIYYMGIFCFVFKKRKYWSKLLERFGFKDIKYENLGGFSIFTAQK